MSTLLSIIVPIIRVFGYIFLLYFANVGLQMLLAPLNAYLATAMNGSLANLSEVVWQVLSAIVILLLTALVLKFERVGFLSIGLESRFAVPEIIIGFFVGGANVALVVAILYACGNYHLLSIDKAPSLLIPLLIYLVGAFVEETVFRGYVFQFLERRWGTIWSLAFTSLLFGFCHLVNEVPGATAAEKLYGCICLAFEAGLLLNAAFLIRRNLWFATGLHWAWNYFEGTIFGTIVSGTDIIGKPLMHAKMSGPFLATGGAFGPEASMTGLLIGIILGVIALKISLKNGNWRQADPSFQKRRKLLRRKLLL